MMPNGRAVKKDTVAMQLLRSTVEEHQRLRAAAEGFRVAVVESGALCHVSQDKYLNQLRALEAALASNAT